MKFKKHLHLAAATMAATGVGDALAQDRGDPPKDENNAIRRVDPLAEEALDRVIGGEVDVGIERLAELALSSGSAEGEFRTDDGVVFTLVLQPARTAVCDPGALTSELVQIGQDQFVVNAGRVYYEI